MAGNSSFRISGTGCALLDYLYTPVSFSGKDFKKYLSKIPGDGGLYPGKLVFTGELEKFAGKPYSLIKDDIVAGMMPAGINIGGPSIVSLIHASQMLTGQNIDIFFYGCRGNDDAGSFIEEKLSGIGPLKVSFKMADNFTPFTDVFSDPEFDNGNGERVFVNNIGAAGEFSPADLDDSFFSSNIVAFGGTALVPGLHTSISGLLKRAKQGGACTVVNTVYDFINERNNPDKSWPMGTSSESYKHTDILITDSEEALRLSNSYSIREAASFFSDMGVDALIITRGSEPVVFFSNGGLFSWVPLTEMPVSKRVKSELLCNPGTSGDTTGCGDNFAGGVIASAAMQMAGYPFEKPDIRKAVAFGVASGGFACFYLGGTFFEKQRGEKIRLVMDIYEDYLRQTGLC